MGDNFFDVDAALKDHPESEVAAHVAQLHGVDRDTYLKDGLTDAEFLSEFKSKPLPSATPAPAPAAAPAAAAPSAADGISDVSNVDNAMFGAIAAAAPGAAGYALNKLKGTIQSTMGIKGGAPAPAPTTTPAAAKTFATPSEVSARITAAGQPPRPSGPTDVVNWASGKDERTGQYGRGYLGGTSLEHEAALHKQADALEAKNPGYKIKPGTHNLLVPEAEYNKLVAEAKLAETSAKESLGNKAKMAAELRANRLAQVNPANLPTSAKAAKLIEAAGNAPIGKRFITGYNVGDLMQAQNPFEATVSTVGAAAPYASGLVEKMVPSKYKPLAKLLGPVVGTAAPAINYLERKLIGNHEQPTPARYNEQFDSSNQDYKQGGLASVQHFKDGKLALAEKIAPIVKRAIGEFDIRFDPRIKEQPKLQNMVVHEQATGPQNIPKVDLSKYEGYPFITGMSDRTAAGKNLMGVNDVMFKRGVPLMGGQDFMMNNPHLWASAPGVTRQMMEHASAMRDFTGKNPLFMPWQMAPTGSDYAHMTGQSMLAHAEAAMGKRDKNQLDKHMRQFIPDWKGLDHPESLEQFASAPGPVRKAIQNSLDTNFRDRGSLGIGEARLAIADPRQLTTPEGTLFNVGQFNTDLPRSFESGHFSYPTTAPGVGLGHVDRDINIFQALPNVVKERGIIDPRNPSQTDLRALQMKPYSGILTDKVLKDIGYADGGEVEHFDGGGKVGALAALAKKFLPAAEKSVSAAERNANLAKYLEKSAIKEPMYHGTSYDIRKFNPETAGATFVTNEPWFAEHFAKNSQDTQAHKFVKNTPSEELDKVLKGAIYGTNAGVKNVHDVLPTRANVMQLHVNAQNPFDYSNPEHVDAVLGELNKMIDPWGQPRGRGMEGILREGNWEDIEKQHVQQAIKNLGHDAFWVKEGGVKNLGVYNPTQLKSTTGNIGTYDPMNPDIGHAQGGHATPAWQRSEGKNPEGGLNAIGRASYNREHGGHLKAPQPEGGPRKDSFCARMEGMKKKNTSSETANDPDSRINKSLRKWKC
jgi:hypothetical protein